MKNLILTFMLSVLCCTPFFAQKGFEGTIKYKIEYNNLPDEMAGYESMLAKEMIITIKGNKSKTEQNAAMGATTSITDGAKKTITTLMNVMGNKVAIVTTEEELNKKNAENPQKITYVSGTKKIVGYDCKKAQVSDNNGEGSMEIYYTDKIQPPKIGTTYQGLKGFPLQYGMKNKGIEMTFTATEVKKEKIADSEFTIPKDYEITTMEKLQQKMQGQFGGK